MKRSLRKVGISLVLFVALAVGAFMVYAGDYYHADAAVSAQMDGVVGERFTILSPDGQSDIGLIFYPGAKVEHLSYLPLLKRLREGGVTCVLVKMPFNFAFFDVSAAADAMAILPEVKHWYIAGHSLGGAMASSFMSSHLDEIEGLVLLGAYVYGDIPPDRAIGIYGSEDTVLDQSKLGLAGYALEIDGGNHAQFGNYGLQEGDGVARITGEQQQLETAEAILAFMQRVE